MDNVYVTLTQGVALTPVTMSIDTIEIGERDRADFGNIAELSESIKAVGLLHPIVVTESATLVAGGRRLSAVRELGWTEVPVTVVDLTTVADVLKAEADENTCRKPLTPYEASRARERRARVLAPDAKERKAHGQTAPGKPKTDASGNFPEAYPEVRRTRNTAAIGTGYSGKTLDKVDRIRDVAERGVVRQGKAETPAPEPVREVAREALEDIKATGAAVDRAHRQVNDALSRHVESDPNLQRATWRKNYMAAIGRMTSVRTFTPDQVAANTDDELLDELERAYRELGDYIARVNKACGRRNGLRVVGGSQ